MEKRLINTFLCVWIISLKTSRNGHKIKLSFMVRLTATEDAFGVK